MRRVHNCVQASLPRPHNREHPKTLSPRATGLPAHNAHWRRVRSPIELQWDQMTELAVREDVGSPPLVRPLGRMPVAIPEDLEDRALPKASGVVRLPAHIAWSPPYEYDLDDRGVLQAQESPAGG